MHPINSDLNQCNAQIQQSGVFIPTQISGGIGSEETALFLDEFRQHEARVDEDESRGAKSHAMIRARVRALKPR